MAVVSNDLFQFGAIPVNKFQLNLVTGIQDATKKSLFCFFPSDTLNCTI